MSFIHVFLIVFTELFGAEDDKVTSASNDSVSTLTNETNERTNTFDDSANLETANTQ